MDPNLGDTWDYDLMDLMKKEKAGDAGELQVFLSSYAPFAVVNERHSRLLVLRPFRVAYWSGRRSVMNGRPDNGDYQWGITITTSSGSGLSQSYICLPNDGNYTGLKIQGDSIEILMDNSEGVMTNYAELCRKLSIKNEEQDIAEGFRLLCNEQYPEPVRISAKKTIVRLPSFGELTYNAQFHCCEGQIKIGNSQVALNLEVVAPEELNMLLDAADRKLCSKFYEPVLLEMEQAMVDLKNDFWLDEGELPISAEELRHRVTMDRIVFDTDGSIVIYCNDDGVFGWHTIEIGVDTDGNYIEANLAG